MAHVTLYPWSFSRTDLAVNPDPLLVVWAGPIIGVLLPLAVWLIAAAVRMPDTFLLRFFAGFCLLANDLYIGVGSFAHIGDCGHMLRHGSSLWQLWLFGLLTAPAGLWLWNRQGPHFGLGSARGRVSYGATYAAGVACAFFLVLGALVSR